jgi:hypothetical protein
MDLLHQNIASMALMPPHCPLTPKSYTNFFNDSSKLPGGVAPYRMKQSYHPRDGNPIQTLEYNNFYPHWKSDALNWYPSRQKELATNEEDVINLPQFDKSIELYESTRRRNAFAVPLPSNGTNQIRVLFNDKCNIPTFTYARYASQPVNSPSRIDNSLYREDISKETLLQKAQYMNTISEMGIDLYNSVFEDMVIMQMNTPSSDELTNIRKTY